MTEFQRGFHRRYWYPLVLCTSSLTLIYSSVAYSAEEETAIAAMPPLTAAASAPSDGGDSSSPQDSYTINFNNVSITELIRFTSKISGLNFIFEEADLQFSVTVVSEEGISAQSVLSALSQVLRMHNLNLVEQNGNVLITNSKNINQIPRIIADGSAEEGGSASALVTRVFQLKNASITSMAAIIRPLMSTTALLEILPESRQLIVTDVPTNVDQIAVLLHTIDIPLSLLEIESYQVRNIAPADLIVLAKQILEPFLGSNPFILVPQLETNSIYIVSTPALIEKTRVVFEDLDVPPAAAQVGLQDANLPGIKNAFFIYHPKYCSAEDLNEELQQLLQDFAQSSFEDPGLIQTLQLAKLNAGTNSLLFTGDAPSIKKLQTLLAEIDIPEHLITPMAKGVFLYKLQYLDCEHLIMQLQALANKIPSDTPSNQNLIAALSSLECVPSNNSVLISGTTEAIDRVKELIAGFDVQNAEGSIQDISFIMYRPKYLSSDEIQSALLAITGAAHNAGLNDPALIQTIQTMHYVEETNSIVFTGPPEALSKLQQLLSTVDVVGALQGNGGIEDIDHVTFLLYRAHFVAPEALANTLKHFASQLGQSNITDKNIVVAINSVKVIPDKNSLLFTGSQAALERIEGLLKKFDNPSLGQEEPLQQQEQAATREGASFVLYTPRYMTGEELIEVLHEFMQTLTQAGVADTALFDAINNLKWISKTSSLVVSGAPSAIEQVQQLLARFDVPNAEVAVSTIESIDNTSFLVYKLQYHPGNDIQMALKQVAASMEGSKTSNSPLELISAINSIQWLQVTNSLLCTGHQDVLVRLKDLIQNLDIPLRQVFIEVLIVETTLSNQQNFGLAWGGQVKYFNKTIFNTGNFPVTTSQGSQFSNTQQFTNSLQNTSATSTPSNSSIPFSTGFDLGVIGDIIMHKGQSFISLGSLVSALQMDADSTIVLNPKIITQDNRQSSIFVGQNIPYTGAIVTNTQSNTTSTANIEYRDVGVSLTITPILGDGDVVTMDIVQDISELVNSANNSSTSTTVLTGIQTTHTHMETRVHVPDNHFVALSGMINDAKTHFKTGLPCLGGLPVIGAMFSENDRTDQKANIIIFVRPQIVTSYQEYKSITEHQEWLYKDQAGMSSLKEEFDAALDMVKLPENE